MRNVTITIEDSPEGDSFIKSLRQFSFIRKIEESTLEVSSSKPWEEQRNQLQAHLRQAPTLSEEDLQIYEENRAYFDQWPER